MNKDVQSFCVADYRRSKVLVLLLALTGAAGCAVSAGNKSPPDALLYSDEVFQLSADADRAYRESRWIDAARYYQQLTQDIPLDAYAWFRLGNTYAQQGAYDQAVHAYEISIERDSNQPKPWFNLSTAYLLNAQRAMHRSWQALRTDDPARGLIKHRLALLQNLIHDRIEDTVVRTRGM